MIIGHRHNKAFMLAISRKSDKVMVADTLSGKIMGPYHVSEVAKHGYWQEYNGDQSYEADLLKLPKDQSRPYDPL